MASENNSPVATQTQQEPTEEVKQLASKPAILLVPDPRKTVRPGFVTYPDDDKVPDPRQTVRPGHEFRDDRRRE